MIDKIFILKFLKFCVVGFSGMIVDFGVTWILKEKMKLNRYIANSCGFVLAASSNYMLNRIWTFESRNPEIATEYLSFFIISLIGLGLNNLILWLFSDKLKLNFYLSKVLATGVVTLWNFGMNFLFTFAVK
ncbi:GtrA family protein [Paludibacter sp. 221]|uniref:GtrA family protein n=1 Tax=Paludibacter sp. 221 TaxID=2302939 RepID=UPI0013D3A5C1|nr:GtrA family protein [Paludibacter sp. 221]NDV46481.1 GtrA family protein [Paludibacter sp. 221]